MPIDIMRQRFDQFRKQFPGLVKIFINLPYRYQENFIALVTQLLDRCRKIHDEAQHIKEKRVQVTITRMVPHKDGTVSFRGSAQGFSDEIEFPGESNLQIGDKIIYTVFSIDRNVWYSSKQELITGRAS